MRDVDVPGDDPVRARWEDVLADMERRAAAYREQDWTVLVLHPGEVTPLAGETSDRTGFDILVPNNEFDSLLGLVDHGISFTASDVFAASENGVAFRVVVAKAESAETALLFPLYYREGDPTIATLRANVQDEGVVMTHLRALEEEQLVTITHDDPALFV